MYVYDEDKLINDIARMLSVGAGAERDTPLFFGRQRIPAGWQAFSDDIRGDALYPGSEGSLAAADAYGQGHGVEYDRDLCLLECA